MRILIFISCLTFLVLGSTNISASDALGATPAPAFNITDSTGTELSFPRKREGVDIYLFWATWCPYCKALMPHVQSIQLEYGEDVRVYAFHVKDDEDPVAFLAKQGYNFTLLPSADFVMERFGVKGTPGVFLVDSEGNIRFNLYDVIFEVPGVSKSSSHQFKAVRKAPYWAARMRQKIDEILQLRPIGAGDELH